jgi:hypothetical protein
MHTHTHQDRELKLYKGYWHSLTAGELEENVDRVFADIFAWCVHACVRAWWKLGLNIVVHCGPHSRVFLHLSAQIRVDRQLAKPHMMPTVLTPSSLRVAAGAAASGLENGDDKDGSKKKGLRQRLRL